MLWWGMAFGGNCDSEMAERTGTGFWIRMHWVLVGRACYLCDFSINRICTQPHVALCPGRNRRKQQSALAYAVYRNLSLKARSCDGA